MTKEERIANMAADIAEWRILEDSNEKYLEVECGEFLIEMDLDEIENLDRLTKEELATIIFNKYLEEKQQSELKKVDMIIINCIYLKKYYENIKVNYFEELLKLIN